MGTGPLFRGRDQALEIGAMQRRRAELSQLRPQAQDRQKGRLSDAVAVAVLIKKYPSHLPCICCSFRYYPPDSNTPILSGRSNWGQILK